jgi:hypothetical protein
MLDVRWLYPNTPLGVSGMLLSKVICKAMNSFPVKYLNLKLKYL